MCSQIYGAVQDSVTQDARWCVLFSAILCHLRFADPPNGCTSCGGICVRIHKQNAQHHHGPAVVRNGLYFLLQVLQAQRAGYKAAIVHNVDSDQLLSMRSTNEEIRHQITIPSVFIGAHASHILTSLFTYDKE
ncbi:hypothetical protein scyTo_0020335 [Scyliorhinus torazame]|uniref:PA domain-containing protein n=1 Tax=Scyliorhinus torazame TaxID=75743 RepID=A0A401PQ09_SCYTO|nr:hypothetical protein [Scyliorhinus torazame]